VRRAVTTESASLAGNSLRLLVAQVAGNGGWFVSVVLLARALEPAGRGTVAFVTVTALLTSRIAVLGSAEAGKVLAASRPARRTLVLSHLLLLTLLTSVAGAALVVALLVVLPGVRPAGIATVELGLLAAATVVVAGDFAAASFLQGCGRFRVYTRVLAVAPWLFTLALAGLWLWHGVTVTGAIATWVLARVVSTTVLWVICLRIAGIMRPEPQLLRETVHFGLRAWAGGLAQLLNARVDQVLLGIIASEATLGVYAVAVNASEILFYVPAAVGAALLPAVARSPAAGRAEQTLRVFRAVALVTLAAAGVAVLIGPLLIPLAFGATYHASVTPFLLLVPSALGFSANAVFSNALLAASSPGMSSLGPLVSLVVGVVLDLLLIGRWGASGAAAAATVALLCGGAVAACAFGWRCGALSPRALVPRRADLATLLRPARQVRSRVMTRRAGARWS
jgi:O-antigen/teichoic acid export membrane protein